MAPRPILSSIRNVCIKIKCHKMCYNVPSVKDQKQESCSLRVAEYIGRRRPNFFVCFCFYDFFFGFSVFCVCWIFANQSAVHSGKLAGWGSVALSNSERLWVTCDMWHGQTFCNLQTILHLFYLIINAISPAQCHFLLVYCVISGNN